MTLWIKAEILVKVVHVYVYSPKDVDIAPKMLIVLIVTV